MSLDDYIRLEIEDRDDPTKWIQIDRWEDYTITSNLWEQCDSFTLRPTPDLYPQFLAGNQKVRIWCEEALQITGKTDDRDSSSSPSSESLNIGGRDMAAFLVDSAADPLDLTKMTLASLAHEMCDPWMPDWITSVVTDNAPNFYRLVGKKGRYTQDTIRVWNETTQTYEDKTVGKKYIRGVKGGRSSPEYRGVDQDRIRSTSTDGGERRWDVLDEHAKRVACAMWMTSDASLFIGRPRYDESVHEPSLTYKLNGSGNVLEANFRASCAERFSDWKFLAQGSGSKATRDASKINHKINVRDPGSSFFAQDADGNLQRRCYVPTTIRVEKGCHDLNLLRRLARGRMERSALQTFVYTLVVAGHKSENGLLWATDCCVDVQDEKHGITGAHYIIGRDFRHDKDRGPYTTLHLIPSGVWLALDHDEITDEEYDDYMRWKIWW